MKTSNIIRLAMAVLMLLCLLDWPYGYYQFVRFTALAGFSFLAWNQYNQVGEINNKTFLYIFLAVLFQPMFKIGLGRTLWNIVDVVVAVYLIYEIFKFRKD